jgi:hypothetical protein
VLVDPTEEKLRTEFAGVERTPDPDALGGARRRGDQARDSQDHALTAGAADKTRSLPSPVFVPGKGDSSSGRLRMRRLASRTTAALLLATLAACGVRAPARFAPRVARRSSAGAARSPSEQCGARLAGGRRRQLAALAGDRYVWIFGDTLLGMRAARCPRGVVYCGLRADRR